MFFGFGKSRGAMTLEVKPEKIPCRKRERRKSFVNLRGVATFRVSPSMKRAAILVQMTLVLALACVLGVVFNNASPLGLREAGRTPDWTNTLTKAESQHSNFTQVVRGELPKPVVSTPVVQSNIPTPPVIVVAPNAPPPAPAPVGNVTWAQAKEQLADGRTVLVDARVPTYYQAGHIPNAVSLPAQSSPQEFAAFAAKYPPATTSLVIYCGAEACGLSKTVATILTTQHGYTNVKIMPGGYNEYLAADAAAKAAEKK